METLPTNLCSPVADVAADGFTIGVLALQGGYHEHKVMLSHLGCRVQEIRKQQDMDSQLDGLVIPGGESTTMGHLAHRLGLIEPLRKFVASGRPVMGTCAGLIFLADQVDGQKAGGQELVGGLDVTVQRNFYGSQVESFETTLAPCFESDRQVPAVFIRAPAITRTGPGVKLLAHTELTAADERLGKAADDNEQPAVKRHRSDKDNRRVPVAVRQCNLLGMAFHPELTKDNCWHAYFVRMIAETHQRVPL
mmetsp:Transcript_748/g.1274  ORF Transcript_748/g.1274 Transcript_748/m.1274 type:complete len:250 (-) Transcript_748:388-1137(-)|eukprot:CAMPEP_0119337874 /NCGR_PEP_ID=MMETSP1333-20130426/94902_1 /TAXON_ID=418940 /ORGANISM="Scyphosphaera apsteinii, Strain RCC1455" /LENGTH=249 /DNA_ID=CAMNT_0007349025 /DNA_START=19 /DNA_END=768 /DNA_ORIENTATION=+